MSEDDDIKQFFEILFTNEKLQTALRKLGIWGIDFGNDRKFTNQLSLDLGYSHDDITTDYTWTSRIHPEDKAVSLASWSDLMEGKKDYLSSSFRYQKKKRRLQLDYNLFGNTLQAGGQQSRILHRIRYRYRSYEENRGCPGGVKSKGGGDDQGSQHSYTNRRSDFLFS